VVLPVQERHPTAQLLSTSCLQALTELRIRPAPAHDDMPVDFGFPPAVCAASHRYLPTFADVTEARDPAELEDAPEG
jgi:hypothetical protein